VGVGSKYAASGFVLNERNGDEANNLSCSFRLIMSNPKTSKLTIIKTIVLLRKVFIAMYLLLILSNEISHKWKRLNISLLYLQNSRFDRPTGRAISRPPQLRPLSDEAAAQWGERSAAGAQPRGRLH